MPKKASKKSNHHDAKQVAPFLLRLSNHLFPTNNQPINFPNLYSCDIVVNFIEKFLQYNDYTNVITEHIQGDYGPALNISVDATLIFQFKMSRCHCIIVVKSSIANKIPSFLIQTYLDNDSEDDQKEIEFLGYNKSSYYDSFFRFLCAVLYIIDQHANYHEQLSKQRILELYDFSENFLIKTLVHFSSTFHCELRNKGIISKIIVYRNEEKYYYGDNNQFDFVSTFTNRLNKIPIVRIQFHNSYPVLSIVQNSPYPINFTGNSKDCIKFKPNKLSLSAYVTKEDIIARINKFLTTKTFIIYHFLKEIVPIELNFIIMMIYIELCYFDWSI